jgi:uncharacterized protein YrrD
MPRWVPLLEKGNFPVRAHAETAHGREPGKIEDFDFAPETGVVKGYELSGGKGRSFLPTPASFRAGADVAFVDPSAVETIIDLKEALRGA